MTTEDENSPAEPTTEAADAASTQEEPSAAGQEDADAIQAPSVGACAAGGINSDLTLLPAQRKVLDAIRVPRRERPLWDASMSDVVRGDLEAALADVDCGPRGLWVTKRSLSEVLGCEAYWTATQNAPFEWTPQTASGVLLVKAIELSAYSDMGPEESAGAAVGALSRSDSSAAQYLKSLTEADRAEATATCAGLLVRLSESFPPILPAWRPAVGTRCRTRLLDGRVTLAGQYDLTLGSPLPERDGLVRAGRVIVEVKTGAPAAEDLDDLLFCALLETLTVGVPPLGVGTFYVADASIDFCRIEESDLYAAVGRTVAGVSAMAALVADGAAPERSPGRRCTWCPLAADCGPGLSWLSDPHPVGLPAPPS